MFDLNSNHTKIKMFPKLKARLCAQRAPQTEPTPPPTREPADKQAGIAALNAQIRWDAISLAALECQLRQTRSELGAVRLSLGMIDAAQLAELCESLDVVHGRLEVTRKRLAWVAGELWSLVGKRGGGEVGFVERVTKIRWKGCGGGAGAVPLGSC